MSSVAHPEPAAVSSLARVELWFRSVMIAFAAVAGLLLAASFGLMVWAQNEFTGPESVVNAQATMLARHGTLYYSLKDHPYTVCAYMPIVYHLQAMLIRMGFTSALAGRLISFAALIGIVIMVWRLALVFTNDRLCAATAAICAASTSVAVLWGTAGQVDMLAIFFSIAAFERFSRYSVLSEKTLVWAGILAGLAIFTKQTTIACPVAIFLVLSINRKKVALIFGTLFLAITGGAVLLVNALLDGRFLTDTVRANLNPFAISKLTGHLHFFLASAGGLLLIAAAGGWRIRGKQIAPFVYLGCAMLVFFATAPKVGSDFNYQIETDMLLAVCAAVALDQLRFFPLSFSGSKQWVTLLQIPLAVFLAVNFRLTGNLLLARIANEQQFRSQIALLRPYLDGGGRLLSVDYNSMARLRGQIEVEPLIYGQLVEAGMIDPEPVRRDIATRKFAAICLWTDLSQPQPGAAEIAKLPAAQNAEISKHYRLVARIPGPYLDGLYLYKPLP